MLVKNVRMIHFKMLSDVGPLKMLVKNVNICYMEVVCTDSDDFVSSSQAVFKPARYDARWLDNCFNASGRIQAVFPLLYDGQPPAVI